MNLVYGRVKAPGPSFDGCRAERSENFQNDNDSRHTPRRGWYESAARGEGGGGEGGRGVGGGWGVVEVVNIELWSTGSLTASSNSSPVAISQKDRPPAAVTVDPMRLQFYDLVGWEISPARRGVFRKENSVCPQTADGPPGSAQTVVSVSPRRGEE